MSEQKSAISLKSPQILDSSETSKFETDCLRRNRKRVGFFENVRKAISRVSRAAVSHARTEKAEREKTSPNNGAQSPNEPRTLVRQQTRSLARSRIVWVLVIKCITRLVYTESGPRNLQSRLVCRFNRTLLGTEFMARPMVYLRIYNSESLACSRNRTIDEIYFQSISSSCKLFEIVNNAKRTKRILYFVRCLTKLYTNEIYGILSTLY